MTLWVWRLWRNVRDEELEEIGNFSKEVGGKDDQ